MLEKEISDRETLYRLIRDSIANAIETALKSVDIHSVHQQIQYMCHQSFDIPTHLHEWAKQKVDDINTSRKEKKSDVPKPTDKRSKPVLTKKSLYHASLCCCAISTCDASNYKEFFDEHDHGLKHVSMSRSKDRDDVDRYIIAMQDDAVYMAFQSEPTLSWWIDNSHESFADGME